MIGSSRSFIVKTSCMERYQALTRNLAKLPRLSEVCFGCDGKYYSSTQRPPSSYQAQASQPFDNNTRHDSVFYGGGQHITLPESCSCSLEVFEYVRSRRLVYLRASASPPRHSDPDSVYRGGFVSILHSISSRTANPEEPTLRL